MSICFLQSFFFFQSDFDSESLENRIAKWSPTSNQFVYLDAENNLILVDLETGTLTPITVRVSGRPVIKWSGSGEYIAVQIPDRYSWRVGIVKIP